MRSTHCCSKCTCCSADEPSPSAQLARRFDLRFPLLHDPGLRVIQAYGLAMLGQDIAVPATLVIGRDRRVLYRHVGESMVDRPDLLTVLDRLPVTGDR